MLFKNTWTWNGNLVSNSKVGFFLPNGGKNMDDCDFHGAFSRTWRRLHVFALD